MIWRRRWRDLAAAHAGPFSRRGESRLSRRGRILPLSLAGTALLLAAASTAVRASNPPAADAEGAGVFLKAAEYRQAPAGLVKASDAILRQAAKFLLSDTGIENTIRDESGKYWPPYIYHAVIDDDNHFSYRISYPSFHHAYLIEAFLNYYNYTGDPEGMRRARQLADWTIAHSTPPDWAWPNFPWSTFAEGRPGGFEDKDNLQPDKAGHMGLAYARLYEVTGDNRYLEAAKGIADTLTRRQSADGSWPFRVNPRTGDVYQQYAAGLFMPVAFLEKMYRLTQNLDYKNAQITAWMWVMRNPVRRNDWSGFYEDIAKGADSQVYYAPAQTIRLLLRYRTPANRNSYLKHAQDLFDYTMDGLAFDDSDMGLLLREQTAYLAATPSSTLSWSMMAAEMFHATGEQRYREVVIEALRSVTRYGLKPDGRTHNTMLGGRIYGDSGSWYSLTSPVVRYIYQDMGCLPELAPVDQNHLLRSATEIRKIAYSARHITYQSLPDSVELLKVTKPPVRVTAGGRTVPAGKDLQAANAWLYNARSQVLLVRHTDPNVDVSF